MKRDALKGAMEIGAVAPWVNGCPFLDPGDQSGPTLQGSGIQLREEGNQQIIWAHCDRLGATVSQPISFIFSLVLHMNEIDNTRPHQKYLTKL